MRRIVRGLGAAAVLAILLFGAPVLLLQVGRWDGLAHLHWSNLLVVPDTGALLMTAMTLAGWLAWAVVLASVLAEVVALVGHRQVVLHLPGARWLQPAAAALVLALAGLLAPGLGVVAQAAPTASTAPRTPSTPTSTPQPTGTSEAPHSQGPAGGGDSVRGEAHQTATTKHGAEAQTEAVPSHVVTQGEDLWTIAEHYYGDGTAWRRIARHNHLDAEQVLRVGTRLELPGATRGLDDGAGAQVTPGRAGSSSHGGASMARTAGRMPQSSSPPTASPGHLGGDTPRRVVVVATGDCLSSLAQHQLGDASRWPEIARLNRHLVRDPDHIQPGWRLVLPGHSPAAAPVQATHRAGAPPRAGVQRRPVRRATSRPGTSATTAPVPTAPASAAPLPATPGTTATATASGTAAAASGSPGSSAAPSHAQTGSGTRSGAAWATSALSGVRTAIDSGATTGRSSTGTAPAASEGAGMVATPRVAVDGMRPTPPESSRPARQGSVAPVAPSAGAAAGSPGTGAAGVATPGTGADAPGEAGSNGSGSAPALPSATPEATQPADGLLDPSLATAGALGTLLAAAVGSALVLRRRAQHSRRPLGRRLVQPSTDSRHFEAALGKVASTAGEAPERALPTDVLLGEVVPSHGGEEPELLLHDVEAATSTVVTGPPDLVHALLAQVTTGLVLQPWSAETTVVVTGSLPWIRVLDEPQVTVHEDVETSLAALESLVAQRRVALNRSVLGAVERQSFEPPGLDQLRADPDLWEAWAPVVHVFDSGLDAQQWRRVGQALSGRPVGVSVLAHLVEPALAAARVELVDREHARLDDGQRTQEFRPHLAHLPARAALTDLFTTASQDGTTPAPWWHDEEGEDPSTNLTVFPHRTDLQSEQEDRVPSDFHNHPTLHLLGPLDLTGCRGEEPSRARRQCVEYAAWLQLHPGATATMMSRELLVAEGTRRSNMSRLRTWLGSDDAGELYLPDAYSGRIQLHPEVSSDWERMQLLLQPGINRCSTHTLADAMDLVRGAPLADAAPGQWGWAEELRSDMSSTIRDLGLVLCERHLEADDVDAARRAVARALVAAPGDERLLCARIRAEHRAGNQPEVERLVMQLTRQARNLGLDLTEESIALLQEVMEGRRRAQFA